MDEQETISRRDAVVGLGVLGALSLALVGAIMFRIVNSAPRHATPMSAPTWADAPADLPGESPAESPAIVSVVAPTDDRYASGSAAPALPPAEPIPTIEIGSSSMPAAAMAPAPETVQSSEPAAEPQPPEITRPRFVAPSGS